MLTLLLRKNHARARYSLWLIASAKFLIPFSLLVFIGSHLNWSKAAAIPQSSFAFAIQEISQPFALLDPVHNTPVASTWLTTAGSLLPVVLLLVWLCGCASLTFYWCLRWRRMIATTSNPSPANSGRELEALRRLEPSAGTSGHTNLILSASALEPGIVGIFRPILLLPAGISDRLTDAQLDAVITHELYHVRRGDNLAATIHMLVEAIFWFHPLVWWIGARLVDERERACDEAVLSLGSDPQVYAEGILKVCEFYLESPFFCAAGVTGSNLKKRIEAIMTHRTARNLEFGKKLLLAAMGVLAVAAPVVFGLLQPAPSRAESRTQSTGAIGFVYDAVSVRPNKSGDEKESITYPPSGFSAINVTLPMLVRAAYGVEYNQISGGPDWLNSAAFDVEAKVDSSVAVQLGRLSAAQLKFARQRMLQTLLADRFKLTLHSETKELSIYVLGVAGGGPRLQEAKPGDTYSDGLKGLDGRPAGPHYMVLRSGEFTAQTQPMSSLARVLSRVLSRPVLDKTGLTGNYDFALQWTPDASQGAPTPVESSASSIFSSIQEQLGLKLETQSSPVEVLVIDNAKQPSDN
ncbi:MAG: M56 family metallopeptidase [Candidatus Acidiferrum sp.]